MKEQIAQLNITKRRLTTLAIMCISIAFAVYNAQKGISYKDIIVAVAALIAGVIVFGGERGIRFGFVLWVLTLALGYRTIGLTRELRIHPAEILLWLLLGCVFLQRTLVEKNRLSLPWWLWFSIPFWALAWWPLIAGDAPWDKMLNEFRDFLLLIPLMIVASVVLQHQRYWRYLLIVFFIVGTWISLMGVVEYWLPGVTKYFPAFSANATAVMTADKFVRAEFSFWGGAAATFICVLTLPLAIVLGSWTSGFLRRMAITGAAILHILAIYIGGYRSVWLILIIQILVACVVGLRKRGIVLAMLVLVIAIGGYQFVPNTHERVISGIAALQGQPIDHSAQTRKDRALGAIEETIAAPLGSGWASVGWVHSDFLQVAANVGLLAGLIFFVGYLSTFLRIGRRVLASLRLRVRDDLGLALFVSFIAAGGMLLMEGVSVLPQMALPVWFIWVLVEIWLKQMSEVHAAAHWTSTFNSYPWMPAHSFSQSKANV